MVREARFNDIKQFGIIGDIVFKLCFVCSDIKCDCIQHKSPKATTMRTGNLCAIESWYM